MDKITLQANERELVGKKVKNLRRNGQTPARVYGNTKNAENVAVDTTEFVKVYRQAGETGLIDLKIGAEKIRPVLIREIQHHPNTGQMLHIDFYQVDLLQKIQVPVPVVLVGEPPESVHLGETVVLQPISEIQIEALPTDLLEKVEVDQTLLKEVDDAVTVAQLPVDRTKITVLTPEEEVVIKLAPAITEEMKKLMEEQAAEAAAAQAVEAEAVAEGEEGETPAEKEAQEGGDAETETGAVGESTQEKTETQPN